MVIGGVVTVWLMRFFTPKGLVAKEDFNEVTGQLRKDLDKCDDERAEMMKMLHQITMTLQEKATSP
jgi:prefoldin subunit 5